MKLICEILLFVNLPEIYNFYNFFIYFPLKNDININAF